MQRKWKGGKSRELESPLDAEEVEGGGGKYRESPHLMQRKWKGGKSSELESPPDAEEVEGGGKSRESPP